MKEKYVSPELEMMRFAAAEKLAGESEHDFRDMMNGWGDSVDPSENYDIDLDI